ncbi:MAG: aspartate aminotransferase family protein [Actinobacteria bacterium]|nr:aspartate aminotransferase family protein [Actinomycetota bacterium]
MTPRPQAVPDLDWDPERARAFADRTTDLWQEMLERLPSLPVSGRWTSEQVRDAVARTVPDEPMSDDELFSYLREVVFEWSAFPGHPRFMAYISGAGTVPGAAADLLSAGMNMNLGGWQLSPSATEIELALTRFFANEVFGLPPGAGGIVTTGGAMATFVALKAARDERAGWDVRNEGVAAGPPLVLYLSAETHVVSDRAADMLGVGLKNVRHVGVDDGFRLRVDDLRAQIARDLDAGMRPFAIVGSAGTVATGAVDPLGEIADVCAEHGAWFHVDAAYGGPAMLADDLRPLFAGIERADSIAFDPHKWLYTPHSGGCVVVRDMRLLQESFDVYASYTVQDKEYTQHGIDLGRHGPQFSRGFSALKVWVSLLAHGRAAYGRRISHDAELARYLGERVRGRPEFELAVPVGLSITCFRYVPVELADGPGREDYLNELNHRLMTEIQLDGRVYISNAILGGTFVLRSCIVNFRTEAGDVEAVLAVAAELGAKLDAELRPEALR